jgi:hypothetical protein
LPILRGPPLLTDGWAPISRASVFHILTSVGFVHTEFEAENGWSPDRPNTLQIGISLAGVWR